MSHIQWQRNVGALVDVVGLRTTSGMVQKGNARAETGDVPIPYHPGRETLGFGSGLARADANAQEIVNPSANGAEAYYTYAVGDSMVLKSATGNPIVLRELVVRPRAARWDLVAGSLWFDAGSGRLARAVYRLATPMDIWAVADESGADDVPRWARWIVTPFAARIDAIVIEYGLHEGQFWLPRVQRAEGEAQAGIMRVPFQIEQSFRYNRVNGGTLLDRLPLLPSDTSSDSLSRARRRAAARACGIAKERRRATRMYDGTLMVLMRVPCDTVALAKSPELPASPYDPAEEIFGMPDRDRVVAAALGFDVQARYAPQPPRFTFGVPMTRYNKIEGLSTGLRIDQQLGAGYQVDLSVRGGFADQEVNGELGVTRRSGPIAVRAAAYRRLSSANDWGDPFSLSSSLSAVLFGVDYGFYYRTIGGSIGIGSADETRSFFHLFAERHREASTEAEFTVARALGSEARFTPNIVAQRGEVVGARFQHQVAVGTNPRGFRFVGNVRAEGGVGTFDYSRGAIELSASQRLIGALAGALTATAGTSGGAVPPQRYWYLGGDVTVRGQDVGAAAGNAFWLTKGELGLGDPGLRATVFGDLGWAGDRNEWQSPGRPLAGAGFGLSLMDGLFRFDVAKGIYPERKWRAYSYVEARF